MSCAAKGAQFWPLSLVTRPCAANISPMPYRWSETPTKTELTLWPHQSLTRSGFTWFIGATAFLLTLPLLAVLGSPVVWVLMIFFIAVLAGVWRAIVTNKSDRSMHEELTLDDDNIKIEHVPPSGPALEWQANPHWVSVHLCQDGPVKNYLTIRGEGREIEIGRFLSPEERAALYDELKDTLAR